MSLQPSDKKTLAITATVVVVAAAIIAVATTLLVRSTPHADPQVSVAAGPHYAQISPTYFCDVKMEDCRPRFLSNEEIAQLPQAQFPVETGQSLTLSVPEDIASGPWELTAIYATPAGIAPKQWWHRSGTTYTQVLESTPERTLLGIEIKPASAVLIDAPDGVESGQGEFLFRGHYSVATAPVGYPGPANRTELPVERG